ncbi:sugar phosphate nucleotidyltransferase [Labilibaculum antarcticum]|uniref:sugar phosphate nucleotidyltransferase n=1 Tax=Labilibaculum antarcticum TaxID=1717717 RepID=UPI00374489E8
MDFLLEIIILIYNQKFVKLDLCLNPFNNMNNNYIVIMAGGLGSRFWPMSNEEKPKQFLVIHF